MKRVEILSKLGEIGLVAVVRGTSREEALANCEAVVEGGFCGLEVTFTLPNAPEVIGELIEKYAFNDKIIIGAGTVLDAISARLAIIAGAKFIVSPTFDIETAKLCNIYQIPYLPGCMTINEMKEALSYGVDIVKLFPGNLYSPSIIKTFKAPLPQLTIMPTGGINLENMQEWLESGAVCLGIGGNLFSSTDKKETVTKAQAFVQCYQNIKNKTA